MKVTFHPSAWRAAMRSVIFSPAPPIHSGSRSWTGFGSHLASRRWKNWPSKFVTSSVRRPRMHWIASSSIRSRTGTGGNGIPYASYSPWCQPPPRPSTMRPPARWSRVAMAFARTAGWRYPTEYTRLRIARGRSPARGRRGWKPPPGTPRRPWRRRRRSGPRPRSSRTRGPRSGATARATRRWSCSGARRGHRTSRRARLRGEGRHDFAREQLEVIEVEDVQHLEVGGLGAGGLEGAQGVDDLARQPGGAVLPELVGLAADRRGSPAELGFVAPAADDERDGRPQRRRVASCCGARLQRAVDVFAIDGEGRERQVELLRVARRERRRPLRSVAADDDRRVRLLHGLRQRR